MKNITTRLPFAGIFPPVLRSLWSPITPSSHAKICSTTDSLGGNICCLNKLLNK